MQLTMNKKLFLRHTLIYFLLILGFIYLYVVDVEVVLNPKQELPPQSKVDFIYQQF
jgi:hypothetical protein